MKLHSETIGEGPDIVLLHGWGVHCGIWQFVAEKLSSDFRVTVVDLPGFGRSELISEYTTENIVSRLLRVTPPKAIWLGWSLGGMIATAFALTHPDRVEKLICVASTPKFVASENWPGMDIAILQQFNEQLEIDYDATLMRFITLQFCGKSSLNKEMIRWFSLNLFLYGKPKMETLMGGLHLLEHEDLRDKLSLLPCPVLYILGEMDTMIPSKVSRHLKKLGPNIQSIILPKASHALFLSHQEKFITEVRHFCHE
jgi:pimeloyl-[acyl-carrier protein] methyl ester esterase